MGQNGLTTGPMPWLKNHSTKESMHGESMWQIVVHTSWVSHINHLSVRAQVPKLVWDTTHSLGFSPAMTRSSGFHMTIATKQWTSSSAQWKLGSWWTWIWENCYFMNQNLVLFSMRIMKTLLLLSTQLSQ